jgi:hypothetical protein
VIDRRVVVIGALPAVAFMLHDLIFQLPDNQHEATLGFFVTVGGLLAVWALSGCLAAGNAPSGHAMARGALAGLVSVAILWLAFAVLNNLFIDRMSYEPDRIRAFHRSGYGTMREFVNRGLVFSPFFPLLMAVAAVSGGIGGAIGRIGRRLL